MPKKDRARIERLEIRVEPDEKDGFQQAAKLAGIPLSAWIRERLRRIARRELEEANKSIPFLKSRV